MGWHSADASWWPVIAESISGVWSREAALMDLRWFGDRKAHTCARIPGRPFFVARWGWKEKRARNLMAGFEWWDDTWGDDAANKWGPKRPRANSGPAKGQQGARKGPAPSASKLPFGGDKGQRGASRGPVEGHEGSTGALDPPTHSHDTPPSSQTSPADAERADFDRVMKFWAAHRKAAKGHGSAAEWSSKTGKKVRTLLKDQSLEDVRRVILWLWTCTVPGSRPVFLRSRDTDWKTVVTNFEEYAVLSKDWEMGAPGAWVAPELFKGPRPTWLIDGPAPGNGHGGFQWWDRLLLGMQKRIGHEEVETWLKGAFPAGVHNGAVDLEVKNQLYAEYISEQFASELAEVAGCRIRLIAIG